LDTSGASDRRPTAEELVEDDERRALFLQDVAIFLLAVQRYDWPGGLDGFLVMAVGGSSVLQGMPTSVSQIADLTGFSRRKVGRHAEALRDAGLITYKESLGECRPTPEGEQKMKRLIIDVMNESSVMGMGHYYPAAPDPRIERHSRTGSDESQ
jgi:DNA-binding transcriptional ArsR family regulator